MKENKVSKEQLLDAVSADIRRELPDDSAITSSAARVWATLSSESSPALAAQPEQIRGCEDFRTLFPWYLGGRLNASRVLLLEDHLHECFECSKALKLARNQRTGEKAAPAVAKSWLARRSPAVRLALASALVLTLGLASWPFLDRVLSSFRVFNAVVLAANGQVYRVSPNGTTPLQSGAVIQRGEKIRTAKGSVAVVKLSDGTRIEMAERAEFSLSTASEGTTINLDRGNVIVEAAKQKSGQHLYVRTDDALVSVVGTIFSVNNGTKGSRVSVVEGEVHVEHGGKETKLLAGDQTSTSNSVEPVPVQQEVSWSQSASRYQELLAEVARVRQQIAGMQLPGVRHSTRLLDLMPGGTVLYLAIPNLSESVSASYDLIKQKVVQNPELQAWWNSTNKSDTDKAFAKVREFGSYLGDEIAIGFEANDGAKPGQPILLAEVRNADGLRSAIEQVGKISLISDPATAVAGSQGLNIWLTGNLLVASPNLAELQKIAATVANPSASQFNTSSFYARIADRYRDGVGVIAAADLEKISPKVGAGNANISAASAQLGLTNLKHLIAEIRTVDGHNQNSAELTFKEANKGFASWLAQPAPLGSLNYISPDATVVGALAIKDPAALADNLISALSTVQPKFGEALSGFEAEHGLSLRNDIAAPLGGEFAFAVDGPVLPLPSWKILVEVYDQAKMQDTLSKLVAEVNRVAVAHQKAGVSLTSADNAGQKYFTVTALDSGFSFSYTFTNGYLIIAQSTSLIDRALRYAESGNTITKSPRFIAALPEDKQANFSAMLYQNLGSVLAPLAQNLGSIAGGKAGDKVQGLATLADGVPALAYAYSFGDRITVSMNSQKGAMGMGDFLALPGSMAMQGIISGAMKH